MFQLDAVAPNLLEFRAMVARATNAPLLLVDDDPWIQRAAARVLATRLNVDVVTAGTAQEALEKMHAGDRFAGAIVDLHLKDLCGAQLIDELVRLQPDLRCGIWSAELWLSEVEAPLAYFVVEKRHWIDLVEAVRRLLDDEAEAIGRRVSGSILRRDLPPIAKSEGEG